jgi:kynurenine formamidase
MRVVDLSMAMSESGDYSFEEKLIPISSGGVKYNGVVYDFKINSMCGTYLDLPGHIRETDDGADTANYPVEKLYRVDSAVIHLDRADVSGAVTAEDLIRAWGDESPRCGAVIVNALGRRRFDAVAERSVFLSLCAVDWIIGSGAHLLVSDIYESPEIHGVFYRLFEAGVSTVCLPVNLHKLDTPRCKVSVFAPPAARVTQIPCRVIAELDDLERRSRTRTNNEQTNKELRSEGGFAV